MDITLYLQVRGAPISDSLPQAPYSLLYPALAAMSTDAVPSSLAFRRG